MIAVHIQELGEKGKKIWTLSVLCLMLFVLPSCAPKANLPNIQVNYYPQCYAPFKDLNDYQERMAKRRVFYVTSGAVTGAAVGAFAGVATAGWQGAVAGGIAGGVLGAAAGFSLAKIEEIKEEDKRLASYRLLIGDDLANATALEMAALKSLKCYIEEFDRLQNARNSQQISQMEYSQKYKEIRAGMTELGKLTSDAKVLMAQREMDLRSSLQKEISRSQPSSEGLPTLEQRRFQRQQKSKPVRRVTKRPSQRRTIEGPSTNMNLAQVRSTLNTLEQEIRQDKSQQDDRRTEELRTQAMQSKSKQMAAVTNVKPVTHNELIAVYDDYPDKVLQLEAIEEQRLKSLQIMDEAASKTGIDMV